jgi:hypothetical protein
MTQEVSQQLPFAQQPDHPVLVVHHRERAHPRSAHVHHGRAKRRVHPDRPRALRHDVSHGELRLQRNLRPAARALQRLARRRRLQRLGGAGTLQQLPQGAHHLQVTRRLAAWGDHDGHHPSALGLVTLAKRATHRTWRHANGQQQRGHGVRAIVQHEPPAAVAEHIFRPRVLHPLAQAVRDRPRRRRPPAPPRASTRRRRGCWRSGGPDSGPATAGRSGACGPRGQTIGSTVRDQRSQARAPHSGGPGLQVLPLGTATAQPRRAEISSTKSTGRWATPMPAALNASIFSAAVPDEPEMMAPA